MAEQFSNKIIALSRKLEVKGMFLAVAESCTGGWLAKSCTDLAGSSTWFERGFVTYSNRAKHEMLGVNISSIDEHGAVSEETVGEMVTGTLNHSYAQIAVAISGIAGPGGGTESKPVGTVCFGWMVKGGKRIVKTVHFNGDRGSIRRQAVDYALDGLIELLN